MKNYLENELSKFFDTENMNENIAANLLAKKKDPRQLEFDFQDENKEIKNQGKLKDIKFEIVSHDFHKVIKHVIAVIVNSRPADFTENESLQNDLLRLSGLILEMTAESQNIEYNTESIFIINGDQDEK
ncbi:hypothetical protein MWN63_12335 [Paradonghicola geojensis]|jgi:hypothetical protein|nr:hypothetical protein [Marivivens geojensis]